MTNADQTRSFLQKYLKTFHALLKDPLMVEVALNPDGKIWIERQGDPYMTRADLPDMNLEDAKRLAGSIASAVGAKLSESKPIVSGKILYEGEPLRAQVMVAPVIEGGSAIALRRYSKRKMSIDDISLLHGKLLDLDTIKAVQAQSIIELTSSGKIHEAMTACVDQRLNIVISGGTSTGKTTFASALLQLVGKDERIITIEDAYELFPEQPNSVCMKADRQSGEEKTPAKLLESSLRLRPDRIIVGELRGGEAMTFLEAINTGHGGSFTTIHADTASKAIDRLAMMVMGTGSAMTFTEIKRYCASSIDVIIQLGRRDGQRGVAQIIVPSTVP